jgi:hypothetical protein
MYKAQWDLQAVLREQARGTVSPGILSYTRIHRAVRTRHCVSNVTFLARHKLRQANLPIWCVPAHLRLDPGICLLEPGS